METIPESLTYLPATIQESLRQNVIWLHCPLCAQPIITTQRVGMAGVEVHAGQEDVDPNVDPTIGDWHAFCSPCAGQLNQASDEDRPWVLGKAEANVQSNPPKFTIPIDIDCSLGASGGPASSALGDIQAQDRDWFARHPACRYRVRSPHQAELGNLTFAGGRTLYVVVEQIEPFVEQYRILGVPNEQAPTIPSDLDKLEELAVRLVSKSAS